MDKHSLDTIYASYIQPKYSRAKLGTLSNGQYGVMLFSSPDGPMIEISDSDFSNALSGSDRHAEDVFNDLINEMRSKSFEDAIDEADGEKDGKFSVHDMDSNDGDHDDNIDVGFLADSIMHGPGYIPHYDEDGNKIEEE